MQTIAVVGTGSVGGTLGRRWTEAGHEVIFGSRDPEAVRVRALLETVGPSARAATVAEAVASAEIVTIATPWRGLEDLLRATGDLAGKILIDCTNPLKASGRGLVLSLGHATSGAERIAEWVPGARVVKAFNTTGHETMANPDFDAGAATMFICGDDSKARRVVADLARDLGFDVADVGGLSAARYLEPLAMLWIHLAMERGYGRDFAFRILRR